MKSTNMGRQIAEDELVFLAAIPHVALRAKDDVQHTCFRLGEPPTQSKSNAG
jgi:hypothetical protein